MEAAEWIALACWGNRILETLCVTKANDAQRNGESGAQASKPRETGILPVASHSS